MVGIRDVDNPGPEFEVLFKGTEMEPFADVAPEGPVTFILENSSSEPHDFALIGLPDDQPEPDLIDEPLEEDHISVVGRVMGIEPGMTEAVTFPLERGRYLLISNTPGRYLGHSLFDLTVQPVEGQ